MLVFIVGLFVASPFVEDEEEKLIGLEVRKWALTCGAAFLSTAGIGAGIILSRKTTTETETKAIATFTPCSGCKYFNAGSTAYIANGCAVNPKFKPENGCRDYDPKRV